MEKFSSIEQFKNVIKQVRDQAKWNNTPLPTLTFIGTTKLHGCVSANTMVTLADGSVEKIKDISPGTSIISYNEKTNEVEFDIVDNLIVQEIGKTWVRLDFDGGEFLECTTDHPILTTIGWVEAEKLENFHEIISFSE